MDITLLSGEHRQPEVSLDLMGILVCVGDIAVVSIGAVFERCPTRESSATPENTPTNCLLKSVPDPARTPGKTSRKVSEPASNFELIQLGCPFEQGFERAEDIFHIDIPPSTKANSNRRSSCHFS